MKRLIAQTVSIQSLGVLLVLGMTLWVSRFGGPQAQGQFALVKSINDLQVAMFTFGLPSGLVYVLNKAGRGHHALLRYSLLYTAVLLVLLPGINYMLLHWLHPEAAISDRMLQALLISIGSALLTGYGIQRGIVLVRTDGLMFSLLSILPSVILALVVIAALNQLDWVFEGAYALAGLVSIAATLLYLRRSLSRVPADGDMPINWDMLKTQSMLVFAQGVLFGLQMFLSTAWLERQDATLGLAGLFNIASMVITLPNLLVALVAPVLFNRWSRSLDAAGLQLIRRNSLGMAIVAQILALCTIPLVPIVLPFVFGTSFTAAATATSAMLFAVFAVVAGRILTPALQGLGDNLNVTKSCLARFTTAAATLGMLHNLSDLDGVLALSIAWVLGEYAALIVILYCSRKNRIRHHISSPTSIDSL
jgi:O-antigen/teichoic acid export membrane protein